MIKISVVVPIYRTTESTLIELHSRLSNALQKITNGYEIIFVYDCGGDNSWEVIKRLSLSDVNLTGVKLTKNYGQHAATLCGISVARGHWIVTIDDDLEHLPEDIYKLYEKALEGYELVYGVLNNRTHNLWRNITSELGRKMFKLAMPSLNYQYTSFRIIKATIAKSLINFDSPYPFIDGYLAWITHNYSFVNVEHGTRFEGNSNYNLTKLLSHFINIFVAFSELPLRLATWIGIGSFGIGFIWFSIILCYKLLGGIEVSGYASLMAGIILFGGLQMFVLGIFGEYLGRINFKTSKKPLYLISEKTLKKSD